MSRVKSPTKGNTGLLSGKGGGVLVYFRDIFKCSVIELETFGLECLILNVVLSARINFSIMVLYNPPSHNDSFYHDFDELFKLFNCHTNYFIGRF